MCIMHTHSTTYRGNFTFTANQEKCITLLAINNPCTIVSNPNGGIPSFENKSVQKIIIAIVSSIQYIPFWELFS